MSWGAACCGGGFGAPAIISGDNKAQLSASYSMTNIIVDNVDSIGVWRKQESHQSIQVFQMEGARVFRDRWQLGATVPIIQRSFRGESFEGLSDITSTLAYEYLPDWNYNPYRPKGIGFLQLIIPSGKSKYESQRGGLDSRGNGLWALGFGTLLTKSWGDWDTFASINAHHSFSKHISNTQVQGELRPGWGGSGSLGMGYNTLNWRMGGSLSWTYEDPVQIFGSSPSRGQLERYATGLASVTKIFNDEWVGSFIYSDQTLFGSPLNTSLGQTFLFQVQRNWPR